MSVIRDFLRVLGAQQAIRRDVRTDMTGLRDGLTHWSWTSQFHGLPGLCRTPWLSRGDFVAGVVTRYPETHDFLDTRDDVGRLTILKIYQFSDLPARLSAFNCFMFWSDETSANLSTARRRMVKIIERFTELERIGNIYAGGCRVAFLERILLRDDLTQLLLGFMVTARGLAWYRGLPDESLQESALLSKRLVLQQVRLLHGPFQSLLAVDGIMANIGGHNYRRFGEYAAGKSTTSFWEPQCPQVIPGANGLPPVPYLPVAAIA